MELHHLREAVLSVSLYNISECRNSVSCVWELRYYSYPNLYNIYTGLGDLSVDVTGSGSGEAGSPYTLTCTVTLLHRASDSSVSIQWQGPRPHTITTTTDISTNEMVSSQLPLDPLTLADGGDYTCTATYTVGEKTSEGTGNATIIVISKLAPYNCASASLSYVMTLYYSSTSICDYNNGWWS